MKNILKYLWVIIALAAISYDTYLHLLISSFQHASYELKPEFVAVAILYMIVTFPIGMLFGVIASICNCLIINDPLISKGFTFLLLVVNYYLLFVWIPGKMKKD